MLKYLQVVFDRHSGLKNGITHNNAAWVGQPDTPATEQADMDAITVANDAIDDAEDVLAQKIADARLLAKNSTKKADETVKRAIGIHATNPGKLVEYNIPVPGVGQAVTIPVKAIILSIAIDDDGIGFKLKFKSDTSTTVDYWEIERGSTDAAVGILAVPFPFLKTTKKLILVDDDVVSGRRYYYRIRGVNSAGAGEWSAVVNAVQ